MLTGQAIQLPADKGITLAQHVQRRLGEAGPFFVDAVAGSGVATIILAGWRTTMMAGGEDSKAA